VTEIGGITSLVGSTPTVAFDLDDMFGIRRALHALPAHLWDDFFATWAEIADACALDVERIQEVAALVAKAPARCEEAGGEFSNAWGTVSAAMCSYLAWRAQRCLSTEF